MLTRKEKYIEKAIGVFRQEGLRLSLDEIADKMGITKKTLYNHFGSKEELLSECMHSFNSNLRQKMDVMLSEEINAIDGMKRGGAELALFFQTLSPIFLSDLRKMFPKISHSEHAIGFDFFLESVRINLNKGIGEGMYRQDIDTELATQFIAHSVGFYIQKLVNSGEFGVDTYFLKIIDYHLHAIVTEKGLLYLSKQ
jgi:AcrR family transcriptional regulator